ncbi:MAG: hypothetical protein AB4057_12030 [Crocosphaera sp.]
MKPENLITQPDSSQKVFEQIIDIAGQPTKVRVTLNQRDKLHSVHI